MMRRKKNEQKHSGYYSANYCMVCIFFVFAFTLPFLGKQLFTPAYGMSNYTVKKMYILAAEALVRFSERLHIVSLSQTARGLFLHYTGLEGEQAWDRFFYTELLEPENAETVLDSSESIAEIPVSTVKEYVTIDKAITGEKNRKRAYHTEQIVIPYSAAHPLRVLFFGDSQMYNLAAGMRRALQDDTSVIIEEMSVHSSGFLRSDYYNWPKKLAHVLQTTPQQDTAFHAAVMLLGMNDHQDMLHKKHVYTVETEEWETLYIEKVKQHIDLVLCYVPRVYWLSLPAVRTQKYNDGIGYLDGLYERIAKEYDHERVIRVNLKEFTAEYGTGYIAAIKIDGGTWEHFMQDDGIHYSLAAGEYLMQQFLTTYLKEDYLFD